MVDGEEVIVSQMQSRSAADARFEEAETAESLREARSLYRDRNIGEGLKDAVACVLNDRIIDILVQRRPETIDEWQRAVPHDVRVSIDRGQMWYLDGIL